MTQAVGATEVPRPISTPMQHAIRVLVLLDACGEEVSSSDPSGTAVVIRSELRLQALDFWLRNPDYLAEELLSKVEAGVIDPSYLTTVEHLLNDPEPDLHWYPMPRWHYGAYEALDDAFSVLSAYGLALVRRRGGIQKTSRSQFFLTGRGREFVAQLSNEPRLSWYVRQAQLVALVAGDDLGGALKNRQYKQAEYARTELGVNIAPIAELVRQRLAETSLTVPSTAAVGAPDINPESSAPQPGEAS